jgi:hypothetical protein
MSAYLNFMGGIIVAIGLTLLAGFFITIPILLVVSCIDSLRRRRR